MTATMAMDFSEHLISQGFSRCFLHQHGKNDLLRLDNVQRVIYDIRPLVFSTSQRQISTPPNLLSLLIFSIRQHISKSSHTPQTRGCLLSYAQPTSVCSLPSQKPPDAQNFYQAAENCTSNLLAIPKQQRFLPGCR